MQCPKCGYAMSDLDEECPRCKKMAEDAAKAPPPPPTAAAPPPVVAPGAPVPVPRGLSPQPSKNNSGTGMPPPLEVMNMGWSWGGLGLTWIWGIGNQVWIALLALIPYAGLPVGIWLGIAGHQMAWKKRQFQSIEQFRQTMRVWNTWGLVLFILQVLFTGGIIMMSVMLPTVAGGAMKARQSSCMANVKQVSLAIMCYSQDYDGYMPHASTWVEACAPYIKNTDIFVCPSGAMYDYNKNLSMYQMFDARNPGGTGMLYEIDDSGQQVYPHASCMNVGFMDGHCKACTEEEVKSITW